MADRVERFVVASACGVVAGLAAGTGAWGLRAPAVVAGLAGAAVGVAVAQLLARRLPAWLDGARHAHRGVAMLWTLLALLAVGQTGRQVAFHVAPEHPEHSVLPWDAWTIRHCCLTAYTESARLAAGDEPNPYDPRHYRPAPDTPRRIDGFQVDGYHYPPTFLLAPLLANAATGADFLRVRALWFGVSALVLLLALGGLARRLSSDGQQRALAVAPVVWLAVPVQLGLQMSNVQILVLAVAVLAWAAWPRRPATGGALLAAAVVGKLFPGLLGLYLVAQRRWRDVAWTAAAGVVLIVVAWGIVGTEPFRSFVTYEMPRLSSGEAFPVMAQPVPAARNMAPFGLPLKMGVLGVPVGSPDDARRLGRVVGTAYGLFVLGLTLWAGRRRRTTDDEALVWLALLSLGTLASPFAPSNYVLTSVVWMAAVDRRVPPAGLAVVWLLLSAPLLLTRDLPAEPQALAFLPAQLLAIALPVWVLLRAAPPAPPDPAA